MRLISINAISYQFFKVLFFFRDIRHEGETLYTVKLLPDRETTVFQLLHDTKKQEIKVDATEVFHGKGLIS